MSDQEQIAGWTGTILLALSAVLMWRDAAVINQRFRRRANEPPVEVLAEELKQAWSEHHIA
ncbi:MAG: hypothetical protein JOY62_00905 [Acidobacteriaceae bacterium]|nr:hypothetical protein [Acidobacteriaceae bacterium]MBV9778505.1 hypothetical protein [Acidobacteriaceae bacterium]